ncbi:hypothetical protein Halru_3025 [Halovivax ruber XH-70]|uniref:DUF6997 domain-containing protein n=1 Tax=Halovivax ruber (strain DSM 18193 / JCM 13892 / XH-70) TaxID=797302 RepID=L0IH70_HALRX|nr:hypothetical protein [Halovivax ruber]AGB17591.1 hypothetical protein Halru_3025 [Halovivax ruber XH-70]
MVFESALRELRESAQGVFGPTSFRGYVDRHGIEAGRTPRHISVDSLADLDPGLRDEDVMVLRMGSAPDGRGTGFVLVEASDGIGEYFLEDEALFCGVEATSMDGPVDRERLLSFELLPSLSESSLVNLGLASGVLSEALDLDRTGALAPPATGQSTFSFDVCPRSDLSESVRHRSGQVEIDTLFAERRDGELALFVIEAKTGPRASLAKHKLVYPLLAIADSVPAEIELVPVYLRCRRAEGRVRFEVAECTFPDPRARLGGVEELSSCRERVIELELGD